VNRRAGRVIFAPRPLTFLDPINSLATVPEINYRYRHL